VASIALYIYYGYSKTVPSNFSGSRGSWLSANTLATDLRIVAVTVSATYHYVRSNVRVSRRVFLNRSMMVPHFRPLFRLSKIRNMLFSSEHPRIAWNARSTNWLNEGRRISMRKWAANSLILFDNIPKSSRIIFLRMMKYWRFLDYYGYRAFGFVIASSVPTLSTRHSILSFIPKFYDTRLSCACALSL